MIRKTVYPYIKSILESMASALHKRGFTPNHITLIGLAFSFVSGCIYASGHFFWGGMALLASGMADMLDGALARVSGKTTKFGAFLDSSLDRYADCFLYGGLALHYARIDSFGWSAVCLGIIAGSFVTSYTKARAENFIPECGVGVFERAERLLTLGLFSAVGGFVRPLCLIVLLVGTNFTAIQRILYTRSKLSDTPSENSK